MVDYCVRNVILQVVKKMKNTVVIVLLILSIITGCSKNVDYDTDDNLIKVCSSSWGHYVYEYYDRETGVTYLCTTDGGITPKVNSNGYVYESNR